MLRKRNATSPDALPLSFEPLMVRLLVAVL